MVNEFPIGRDSSDVTTTTRSPLAPRMTMTSSVLVASTLCLLAGGCDPTPGGNAHELDGDVVAAGPGDGLQASPADQLAGTPEASGSLTVQTPNILFVVADDIGVDNISAYAEHTDSASTPSIDSLADDGVLFRNTWANPMCSPSRASLFTGRHAFRHGLLHPAGAVLDSGEETVAEVLQGVGYTTAMFGKWHLGTGTGTTPADQGYDHFSGALSGNISDYFSWTKTTQDVVDGSTTESTTTETGYATSINVSEAQSWISQQTDPWMVTLTFNAGHSPFHVPPSALHSYGLSGTEGDECDNGSGVDAVEDCYRAMVEAMDTELGGLVTWLDAQGELADTLVIFIGDNGTAGHVVIDDGVFSSSHAKTTVYEGGVNVPFIVYGPSLGVEQGAEVTDLIQGLDVFSTMLDVAGGTGTASEIDSRSLLDYLVGNTVADPRSVLYTELYSAGQSIDRWAMTNGVAKYLYTAGDEECYNLNFDPGESTDRYVAGGPIIPVCNGLSTQRPCESTDECPTQL